MRGFAIVWLGQTVSLLGSKLTEFALGVWVYRQTESITQFALILLFIYLPNILILPLAGSLVDRWNRRWVMLGSDAIAAINTVILMVLVSFQELQLWHIYLAIIIRAVVEAFQVPAYTASIAQLVPRQHQTRANGMVQISKAFAKILAPAIAGFLIGIVRIPGILLIDLSTFAVGAIALFMVRFPAIASQEVRMGKFNRLWQETILGWQYIVKRPGLLRLLLFVTISYYTAGVLEVVFWPFVLNFGSSAELGLVLSIGGCGMLLGSGVMSLWGGPNPRIYGIFTFLFFQGICLLLGGFQASVAVTGIGIFGYLFAQPIVISCDRAIWQSKVPLNLQGRVFALQQIVERAISIAAYLIVGPLVDLVLEPLMATDGLLASTVGRIIGVGQGRGIGLLLILIGTFNILATLFAYRSPRLRRLEAELPDAIESNLNLT